LPNFTSAMEITKIVNVFDNFGDRCGKKRQNPHEKGL
jgi:hypothetical protein